MEELAKVKRVLRLIQFLAETPAKRVKTLAQLLERLDFIVLEIDTKLYSLP
jgi:hypothetical protein